MDITQDYLRDVAVQCVKEYLTEKKPLTESVTAIALRDNLKPEQVKRAVEVVNQIAYLKLLESAKDRTFEFPLASYDDVMAKILSPEELIEENVEASPLQLMHKSAELYEPDGLSKEASEQGGLSTLSEGQRIKMLYSEYQKTCSEIEKLASDEHAVLDKILNLAHKCSKDEEFMEKVAHLTDGDDTTVRKVSKLVFGQVKKASGEDLFYEEDLVDAQNIVDLIKKAEQLVEKRKNLEKSAEQARNFFVDKAKRVGSGIADVARSAKVSRLNLAITVPSYKPSNQVWNSLQKVPE